MKNLLEIYDKNREKHILKEVTATGAAATFVGSSGNLIDQKFSGAFHRDYGDIGNLLDKHIEDTIAAREWTDDITPPIEQDFIDLEWDYQYDEHQEKDNSKFKSTSNTKMQLVNIEINYDKIIDNTEENKKFVNDSNNWKYIYENKKSQVNSETCDRCHGSGMIDDNTCSACNGTGVI